MNVDKMINVYFKPYFFLKRKIVQKNVRKITKNRINNQNSLTAEQKHKVKDFYKQYTKIHHFSLLLRRKNWCFFRVIYSYRYFF